MRRVGIFWDYENCPVPTTFSGYLAAEKVRQVAERLGYIAVFKAYLDTSLLWTKSDRLTELQSSGISLIHTPHNGKKDSADKILLVDLMLFAFEGGQGEPTTIVLISGDRDFTHAASALRHRGHEVIYISQSNSEFSGLKYISSAVLDWKVHVLLHENPAEVIAKALRHSARKGHIAKAADAGSNKIHHEAREIECAHDVIAAPIVTKTKVEATYDSDSSTVASSVSSGSDAVGQELKKSLLRWKNIAHRAEEDSDSHYQSNCDSEKDVQASEISTEADSNQDVDASRIKEECETHREHVEYGAEKGMSQYRSSDGDLDFKALIDVFRIQHLEGRFNIPLNHLQRLLAQIPGIYRRAGVHDFFGYLELAQKANVVFVFNTGNIILRQEARQKLGRNSEILFDLDRAARQHHEVFLPLSEALRDRGTVPIDELKYIVGTKAATNAKAGCFRHYICMAYGAGVVNTDIPGITWAELVGHDDDDQQSSLAVSANEPLTIGLTVDGGARSAGSPVLRAEAPQVRVERHFEALVDILKSQYLGGCLTMTHSTLDILLSTDLFGQAGASDIKQYLDSAVRAKVVYRLRGNYVFLRPEMLSRRDQSLLAEKHRDTFQPLSNALLDRGRIAIVDLKNMAYSAVQDARAGSLEHYVCMAYSLGIVNTDVPDFTWVELARQELLSPLATCNGREQSTSLTMGGLDKVCHGDKSIFLSVQRRFEKLINILKTRYASGHFSITLYTLDATLGQHPDVYRQAGFSNILEYLDSALRANIIFKMEPQFIFLKPELVDPYSLTEEYRALFDPISNALTGTGRVTIDSLKSMVTAGATQIARAGSFYLYVCMAYSVGIVNTDVPEVTWVELASHNPPTPPIVMARTTMNNHVHVSSSLYMTTTPAVKKLAAYSPFYPDTL